ncbi:MAG: DUF3817 domain-containing protein [Pedobacter sp.]|nr:MAG: DUF3817 domain-containing protein [Pedobacter sp.]
MSSLNIFRKVSIIEAISYLLLLFIAMPLKYYADQPLAVRYVGMIHGLLFVIYGITLVMAWQERKWSFSKVFLIFLSSLVPFVPFWVDKKLKAEALSEG